MTNIYKLIIISLFLLLSSETVLMSAHAFSITPAPSSESKSFIPSEFYALNNGKSAVITRQPIAFESIVRGGTESFLTKLKTEFPESDGWKFLAASDDLKGSFSVSAYYVFYNGTLGGGFAFDYIPSETDPVADSQTELHWIQRIVSNHNRRMEHGAVEDRIAFWESGDKKKQPDVPFFDVIPKTGKRSKSVNRAIPPHFEYDIGKNDPENDHQWSSEVYLASISKKNPKTVTIYNGVNWGWENKTLSKPTATTGKDLKVQP